MPLIVMAHPERADRALKLARRTRAANVVFDPGFDMGEHLPYRDEPAPTPNALRCARWAWREAATGGPWACVIQDDAIPHRDFNPELLAKIHHTDPDVAVSFYYGAQSATGNLLRIAAANAPGSSGYVTRHPVDTYLSTVAVLLPSAWVSEWLAFSRLPYWSTNTRDDECWGAFLGATGRRALATYPCLVEHDNDPPSLAGNSAHGPRRAAVPPPQGDLAW